MQSNMRCEPLRPENSGCARLRVVEPGYKNIEGNCEGCGLPLWIFGAHRVEGLKGLYCSVLCIECELFSGHGHCRWCGVHLDSSRFFCDENCRKRAENVPFGNGGCLLRWMERNRPETYLEMSGSSLSVCRQCGHALREKREGAAFCSDSCKKKHQRTVRKTQNSGIIRDAPIENKGLAEGDFPGGYLGMEKPKADKGGPSRGFLAGGGNGN